MRIRNASIKTSARGIAVFLAIDIVIAYFIITGYLSQTSAPSLLEFCNWFLPSLLAFGGDKTSDKFYIIYLFIFLCIFPFWLLFTRHKELARLKTENYVKYIELTENGINFNFNKSHYDFSCGYSEVQHLEIVIEIYTSTNKYGNEVNAVADINLNFTFADGKEISLSNAPLRPMDFIYSVLDYAKLVKTFSYRFTGAGKEESVRECIEDYLQFGIKQILTLEAESNCKSLSILFFGIGIFFLLFLKKYVYEAEDLNDLFFCLVIPGIFFVVSFFMNILLMADKIKEKFYGLPERNWRGILGKIPYGCIILAELIILVFSLMFCFDFQKPFSHRDINPPASAVQKDGVYTLNINKPKELNYLTKDEIYNLRKEYVKNSLFATRYYEPDEEVFGSIVDKKPWRGMRSCNIDNYKGDFHENIEGNSLLSIQINNPSVLVGAITPYMPYEDKYNFAFCNSEYSKFIPVSLKYNEPKNWLVLVYKMPSYFLDFRVNIDGKAKKLPFQLSGLNARDFGYNIVSVDKLENIEMIYTKKSAASKYRAFGDFIHLGGSCRYKGGCNNLSPEQKDKMFTVEKLPARMDLKLWKRAPGDKKSKADLNYTIIFTE